MDPPPPFKESHIDQGVLSNDQTFFKNFHAPSLTHAFVTQKIRKFRSPRRLVRVCSLHGVYACTTMYHVRLPETKTWPSSSL